MAISREQQGEAEATAWYERSARAGHDWGQYQFANLLFAGLGVDRDVALAVYWYHLAAEQGHARAMNQLARCQEKGWGCARDPLSSIYWYRRSAEAGYFRAQYNYGLLLLQLGRRGEAEVWFERAERYGGSTASA